MWIFIDIGTYPSKKDTFLLGVLRQTNLGHKQKCIILGLNINDHGECTVYQAFTMVNAILIWCFILLFISGLATLALSILSL